MVDLHVSHRSCSDGHVLVIWVVGSNEILEDGFEDVEFGFQSSRSGAETREGKTVS